MRSLRFTGPSRIVNRKERKEHRFFAISSGIGLHHSLPGWSRGAHAPSRAAVDASSTAPTRAFARGSRLAGNPQFWDSPGQSSSRRLPSLRLASRASARRFPNLRAVVFQKRMRTWMRPASHWLGFLLFGHNIPLHTARNHCFLMPAPFPQRRHGSVARQKPQNPFVFR